MARAFRIALALSASVLALVSQSSALGAQARHSGRAAHSMGARPSARPVHGTGRPSTLPSHGGAVNRPVHPGTGAGHHPPYNHGGGYHGRYPGHYYGHNWGRAPIYGGVYRWPHGYHYIRHPIGYVMPRAFLTSTYFYMSWATLGLAAPNPGYQWVRYGPDLLLVEIATGRVVDVRYGVFR